MKPTILVVEDNTLNRALLVDILHSRGYTVLEARDGMEGVTMAREHRPDLVLLDMQMPVLNGMEAARLLRGDPLTSEVKILAVTSFAMKGDRERFLEAGADEYMAKPIDVHQLLALVERLLG